jgi:hypothetical protein
MLNQVQQDGTQRQTGNEDYAQTSNVNRTRFLGVHARKGHSLCLNDTSVLGEFNYIEVGSERNPDIKT